MSSLNFLIVDDSALTTKKLTDTLKEMGHTVVKTAATGVEALEAYRECNPDFVTMDITMPDMDGIQATKNIKAEFPDANIIMVTSHGQEGMVMKAIKAGAKGYVLKPMKAERLREIIDHVMSKRLG
jgi:DNA-binding NarL/FixJ family response regulator